MTSVFAQASCVLLALAFCAIRVVIDFRASRFGWGIVGLVVCALLVWVSATPIPTHAVKIDLPINS